jgi:hypothetical protein
MKKQTLYLTLIALFLAADLSAQNLKIEYEDEREEDAERQDDQRREDEHDKKKKRKHAFEHRSKNGRIYYYNAEPTERTPSSASRWHRKFDRYYENMPLFQRDKKPTVSVAGGTQGSMYAASNAPAQFNYFDASLGYVVEKPAGYDRHVTEYEHQYLAISNINDVAAGYQSNNLTGLKSQLWRIDAGSREGYGYRNGSLAFTPYNGSALVWTSVNFSNLAALSINQQILLNDFSNSVRFGMTAEAGARLDIIAPIAVEASFQRAIVMRRFVFWQWAGSYGLELASQALLDGFIREIREASPLFAPIMNFALKNALAYGIYQLRQEKVNFPFESEAALAYDMFRVGVTLSF